jgi:isopentenyl-diphosphate delta-isomerase
VYQTPVPTNLIEHEYLHVFFGRHDKQEIFPVSEEVESYKRVTIDELAHMVKTNDTTLAPWTREVFLRIEDRFKEYC